MKARTARASLALALMTTASVVAWAEPARGAEGELRVSVAPGTWLTNRHDTWRMGSGAAASASYALPGSDRVAVEVRLHWNRLRGLRDGSAGRGAVYYDATELGATAFAVARAGVRNGFFIGAGPGYRRATRLRSKTVGPASEPTDKRSHRMVLALTAGVQWRPWDRLGGALWTMLDTSPGTAHLEGCAGVTVSVFFWP